MSLMIKRVERPRELKWYHAGAMLYGDWGTSKAYVLGIAFALAGHASWFFLGLMSLLMTLIGICYMIVCRIYPDGGGVYSSVKHRSQTLAVIGAFLLIADYVVTASLSVLDAFHYFNVPYPELAAVVAILVIGAMNWVGPSKGGTVAAVIAVFASVSAIILFAFTVPSLSNVQLTMPVGGFTKNWPVFVGIVLALSGVEAIANMTGVMVEPVGKTSRRAILPVLIEVALLTFLLGVAMNAISGLKGHTEDMLRALGDHYIGAWFGGVISIIFGFLLLSAGNTAIMGLVSIQFALAKDRELPPVFAKLNRFGMPMLALIVATLLPIVVLLVEKDIVHLAALYAIGVVGAITLNLTTSATNFGIRLKLWERLLLAAGAVITLFIEVTIAIQKQNALFFVLTILGVGLILRYAAKMIAPVTMPELAPTVNLLTVAEAKELSSLYKSTALVALRSVNPVLLEEAALHVKAMGENTVYLSYVEETPPSPELPTEIEPSLESVEVLSKAQEEMEKYGITAVPIWQIGENPGRLIARAAHDLKVKTVAIGSTKRSALINLLRGDVLRTLAHNLHKECHLLIVG
ncbi:MAG TPA: universal stress protein [Candidatus Omnitrophota bacterium]|nr:universal stress protein [Candidatus Omnitrophota bacterium]HPS36688.1 universal stress protein [Candidatus Omnitrophota bacterium]